MRLVFHVRDQVAGWEGGSSSCTRLCALFDVAEAEATLDRLVDDDATA
jgi:hypothetical protein